MSADIICLSHLRWNFVHQRPQHLMSRAARNRRVLFVEEPIFGEFVSASLYLRSTPGGVTVAVPMLPGWMRQSGAGEVQAKLLAQVVQGLEFSSYVAWLYTPMALPLLQGLTPAATVYDCMDELSAFKDAPPELATREAQLLNAADVVFTGGHSLYRAKRHLHHNVH